MNIRGYMKLLAMAALGGLVLLSSGCSYLRGQGFEAASSEPVNYREKNGKIDLDSICSEQSGDQKSSNRCKREADIWLEQQCNSYRGLYQSSEQSTAERYRHEYLKFCDASEAWNAEDEVDNSKN